MHYLNIDPIDTARLRLLGAVLALQHVSDQSAHLVPIVGTPHVVVIGTKAEVTRLLDVHPIVPLNINTDVVYDADPLDDLVETIDVGEAPAQSAQDHDESEGGHHD